MTATTASLRIVLRMGLAIAMSLSWLILSGPPAQAFVSNSYVERPAPASTLAKAKPLVVVVERNPNPTPGQGRETITVPTDLYYEGIPAPPSPEPSEGPSEEPGFSSQQQQEQQQQPAPERKPINGKNPYLLPFKSIQGEGEPREFWRFGTLLDPYALPWAGGAVAPNGQYVLQYQTVSKVKGVEGEQRQDWQPFEFRLSAPPPPQEQPLTAVDDPAAKRTRVAWRHNAAPDIVSYTIERQLGDGQWQVAKSNVKPS